MAGVPEKLDEARYFLDQMKQQATINAFRFNLNAFLSAYRSVFYRIERAIEGDVAQVDWYKRKLCAEGFPYRKGKKWAGSDPLLRLLKEARDTDIHERAIPLHTEYCADVSSSIAVSDSVVAVVRASDGTVKQVVHAEDRPRPALSPKESSVTYRRFFNAMPGQEVISTCEYGLARVTELVTACTARGIE